MARRERTGSKPALHQEPAQRTWAPWQIAGALFTAVLLLFLRTVTFDFVRLDDDLGVYLNPQIMKGLTPETILWAIRSTELGFWFPLTRLSELLDVSMFGMSAGGHHFTNAVQHAATAAILYLAFERMTGERWKSALAALLFAVHPLRIESVAWVIERKDTLSGFFWAVSLFAYAGYAKGRSGIGPVAAAFGAALLSKPSVVTLPVILLLIDRWPLRRPESMMKLVTEKLPLFAMSAVVSGIAVWTQRQVGAIDYLRDVPTAARLANVPVAYALYLRDTIWPYGLSVLYPFESWATWQVAGAAALIASVSAIAVWKLGDAPWIATGWFWFLIALLPNIGILQAGLQSRADRFTYLGHMGLFAAVVWTLGALLGERVKPAALAWAGALAVLTLMQSGHWKNTVTLFEHSLTITPGATLLMSNLGLEYMDRGQPEQARQLFTRAMETDPKDIGARNNLVNALLELNQGLEALKLSDRTAGLFPGSDLGHSMRARSLFALNRDEESAAAAMRAFESTRIASEQATHLHQRAVALHRLGRLDESESDLRRALALDPDLYGAIRDLANNLATRKRYPEALTQYGLYLNKVPGDPIAQKAAAELRDFLSGARQK